MIKIEDQRPTPPRWATKLLRWYCAPHLLEEVQGDLEEEFDFKVKQVGAIRARLDYIRSVLGFIKPFAIKRMKSTINNRAMIKNYFKIGWRNILRNKGYSFINIDGPSSITPYSFTGQKTWVENISSPSATLAMARC